MKAYWLRIAFGAVAIFAVGMVIMAFGRRGVGRMRQAIVNQSVNLGANGAPFRVQGRQIGRLSQVNVQPLTTQGFPHIELAVQLDPAVAAKELADCDLVVPADANQGPDTEGLRCLDSAEAESGTFVEVGQVRLEPSGETLQLYVPQSMLDHKNWFRWFRDPPAPRTPASHGASFQLQADSSKAFLMIRDEHGNPVFQLNADSDGAFIQVRDSNGQEVVRFKADSNGVKGNLRSN
jgi:hypothetical protein